ncbi:MAG: hypothetical protein Q7T57_05605 [Dehalococcoidales bacterium]|nr:hypothetical protein [Dehalococcoidales bacterium]
MNSRKIFLLVAACLISLSLILASCSKTVTFEQKRADVIKYLQAFNSIENSFDATYSQITFPQSVYTAADLIAWNAATTKLLTAYDGAISRLSELTPSSLEPSTNTHLQQAKSLYQSQRSLVKALQDARAIGNDAGIVQIVNELQTSYSSGSSLNRATEQLMLQYNISDSEVSYRFRGK